MKTDDMHRLQAQCRIDTPLGPLTLAATARGLAAALFDAQSHHPGPLGVPEDHRHPHLALAAREFAAYFGGAASRAGTGFTVPLDAQGTAFQQQVWQALLGIAPGQLSSYGAVARQVGRPAAARAVGAAVGRNPISIIVPCHRVVGAHGALTGYAGGLPRKQALLALEGATLL
jgi:methylated-DNA-[protein]-cysteine S-methyltransferase